MLQVRKVIFLCFYLYNQTLLPIQKIHFTHFQQYDENHRVYLARTGRQSKKKPMEKWPRMHSIELFIFCIIYASS